MPDGYQKAELFRLGAGSSGWGEGFVQNLVAGDPSILGLGDLVVKDKERRQVGAGRLDFLLQDSPVSTRYEVEIQLGDTDPSHIIRTIEYWDRERRNAPQYEHIAVIVAEGITARFFNVISLFNQHIPLVAIKMSAMSVAGTRTIVFTKVLDHTKRILEDEEAGVPETNRNYWEARSTISIMSTADQLLAIAKTINPLIAFKFNKGYVGTTVNGHVNNFFYLVPQKRALRFNVHIQQSAENDKKIEESGVESDPFDTRYKNYQLRLTAQDVKDKVAFLRSLLKEAYEETEGDSASNTVDSA